MLRKFVVGISLLLTGGCASFRGPAYAAPFAMQLEIQETNGTVGDTVQDEGGDDLIPYIKPLVQIAHDIGYQVEAAESVTMDGYQLWGYTDVEKKMIYLSLDQSGNNFVHTFIHELSHAMQPMKVSPEGQVFAETVACLVGEQLGEKNPRRDSFPYISRFDNNTEVIRQYRTDIDKLVKFFLERLKK